MTTAFPIFVCVLRVSLFVLPIFDHSITNLSAAPQFMRGVPAHVHTHACAHAIMCARALANASFSLLARSLSLPSPCSPSSLPGPALSCAMRLCKRGGRCRDSCGCFPRCSCTCAATTWSCATRCRSSCATQPALLRAACCCFQATCRCGVVLEAREVIAAAERRKTAWTQTACSKQTTWSGPSGAKHIQGHSPSFLDRTVEDRWAEQARRRYRVRLAMACTIVASRFTHRWRAAKGRATR